MVSPEASRRQEEKSEQELMAELFELCQPELSADAFADLQDALDLEQAIVLAIQFLAEEGVPDPENFLISKGFIIGIND